MAKTRAPGPIRAATAHDVARLAGVSQSAVSRAFTPGASIAPDTARKVAEAAARLGYRPNLIARSLITRRSSIIGVAAAYLENPFYPAMLEALSTALEGAGYRVLLFTARPGESSDPILEEVLRYRLDALVMASASLSSRFALECRQAGIPVVLLNRRTEDGATSSVTGDNHGGAALIARFLAAGGHRRPAFIAGLENASTSREREAGFREALAALGLPPPLRAVGHYDFAEAARAARELLSAPERPDALFCANDHMAFAALGVARREFGLEPGREVSIIGFDDAGPASWPVVDLTTYAQPIQPMAARVLSILSHHLADPAAPAVGAVMPGELVLRGSARLPPQGVVTQEGRLVWKP
ncbi:LacI family DNA-binding transcriptional regulator [Roseomonas marmotae]|uniref:LacI family DNA-binding transcriptional regulator n=1 Tax=Roseomonas marmotae TaxID=2768161 RepID=A0ABS3KEI2_9PROT|nr:LacI family DNA-binding transcriptional regulator [Roseomonas marmotae]MBO1075886.1 LacI family DNA-binding transcriptional regulator [Roseomonas marmotae]QTI81927.1 LacI family DNA-binding transcriptional regulator [Roseomonas marmotae]